MSPRAWKFRLRDMLDAALKIQRYVKGMSHESFVTNELIIDAVIRQLTIIGEAASHVPEVVISDTPNIPWHSIRGMRNIVVHEYFGVNKLILWNTVTHNIPDLIRELESIQDTFTE